MVWSGVIGEMIDKENLPYLHKLNVKLERGVIIWCVIINCNVKLQGYILWCDTSYQQLYKECLQHSTLKPLKCPGHLFTKQTPSYWYIEIATHINLGRSSDRLWYKMGIPIHLMRCLLANKSPKILRDSGCSVIYNKALLIANLLVVIPICVVQTPVSTFKRLFLIDLWIIVMQLYIWW